MYVIIRLFLRIDIPKMQFYNASRKDFKMKELSEKEAQYRKMTETPVCICGNMLFQSIGLAGRASFLSSLRSGLIFISTLFLLTPFFHLKGIEWSQPVADVLSAAISLPFIWKILQQLNVSTDDKSSVQ